MSGLPWFIAVLDRIIKTRHNNMETYKILIYTTGVGAIFNSNNFNCTQKNMVFVMHKTET